MANSWRARASQRLRVTQRNDVCRWSTSPLPKTWFDTVGTTHSLRKGLRLPAVTRSPSAYWPSAERRLASARHRRRRSRSLANMQTSTPHVNDLGRGHQNSQLQDVAEQSVRKILGLDK
jgi:hypothetical protein